MSSDNRLKFIAFILASAMLLAAAAPMAFANEEKTTASDVPDITVILGATGSGVGRASVYLDGTPAGTTDSKGNFTFKEAPAAGNHTIMISAKGIKNATETVSFAEKPVVVKVEVSKGKSLDVHVTDRTTKSGLAGASLIMNKYVVGQTDANGDIKMADFPMGIYLVKLEKEGYRTTTTLLIVLSNRTQSFGLSPLATHE
jgi:CarboxypepD_reg-like domain